MDSFVDTINRGIALWAGRCPNDIIESIKDVLTERGFRVVRGSDFLLPLSVNALFVVAPSSHFYQIAINGANGEIDTNGESIIRVSRIKYESKISIDDGTMGKDIALSEPDSIDKLVIALQ